MERFIEIALGLPTAVFTTLVLISLGYWLISLLSGIDGGGDIDADADIDVESSAGLLASLGLHRIPLSLVFTVVSLTAWLISLILVSIVSDTGSTSIWLAVPIIIGSLIGGLFVASPVAHLAAPLFAVHPPMHRDDLIGRECIVKTGHVDESFGQAEVTDAEHGTHIVQVRCMSPNEVRSGTKAHLVDVNSDGVFQIATGLLDF